MKGPCSLERIACAIAERILDDWVSLSCSGRSGKGNEMLPPSLDVLLAARRSSSDMPVGVVDISATPAFLVGPMILLREEVLPTRRHADHLQSGYGYNSIISIINDYNSMISISYGIWTTDTYISSYITMDNKTQACNNTPTVTQRRASYPGATSCRRS